MGSPPPPGTKWTRRVPHPVLIGHAASLHRRHQQGVGKGARRVLAPSEVLLERDWEDSLRPERRVQLVRRDGRDVSTLYGREGGGGHALGVRRARGARRPHHTGRERGEIRTPWPLLLTRPYLLKERPS